ncbi:site-specific integrase [Haloarcula sediminis]|uniref:site-specific integrase n=1 Tax=Haloarcula sediminis TaxID=3111777 RepID=UPI002D799421|nr:site-specific integrase [Haloarcula sp. CK38]
MLSWWITDNDHQPNEWAEQHRQSLTTRPTHEYVLTDREFELLLEACSSLPEPRDLQARFVCLAAGRLGLRTGEIAHFRADWLDWDRMLLRITQHEPCECGYYRRQASQETTHNDQLSQEEAMERRWHPKTAASARSVPVDLSLRLELCLERFTEQYEAFPRSRTAVNRRVNEAAEAADIDGRIYPHCLRVTAASYHAYQGVAPVPLQALIGWSDLATPQKYTPVSRRATADALRQSITGKRIEIAVTFCRPTPDRSEMLFEGYARWRARMQHVAH